MSLFTVILSNEFTFTGGASKSFDMINQLEYREQLSRASNEILVNATKMILLMRKSEKFEEDVKLKEKISETRKLLKRALLKFRSTNM